MDSEVKLHLAGLVAGLVLLSPPIRGEAAMRLFETGARAAVERAFWATVEPRAEDGDRTPDWMVALMLAASG